MIEVTETEKAILRTLIYFDLFGHPLDRSELFSLIGANPEREEFEKTLSDLMAKDLIGIEADYYFLRNGSSSIIDRIRKLERSSRYHPISRFIAVVINHHPFVRGVLVSGSLSKNAISKKDDIDFFIITEPGRIWICRTFLMLFKKVFLLNSKKYFCINYFIDSENLEIPDKNLFTATEIAYLIPLKNKDLCNKFFKANEWIHSFFPKLVIDLRGCKKASSPVLKKVSESLLKGKYGERLDTYFMNLYRKRSKKKFGLTDDELFRINFRSDKHVAKYHPNGFQNIIMDRYNLKISDYEDAHKLDLTL